MKPQSPSPGIGFGQLFAVSLCAMGILEYDNSTLPAPPSVAESTPAPMSVTAETHARVPSVPNTMIARASTGDIVVDHNFLLDPGVMSRVERRDDDSVSIERSLEAAPYAVPLKWTKDPLSQPAARELDGLRAKAERRSLATDQGGAEALWSESIPTARGSD